MSLPTIRRDIADALEAITGVSGHEHRPRAPRAGDAWPQLAGVEATGHGITYQTTWHIYVLLAGDERSASDMIDEMLPEALGAVAGAAWVDQATPVSIPTEAGDMYGLQITARSE